MKVGLPARGRAWLMIVALAGTLAAVRCQHSVAQTPLEKDAQAVAADSASATAISLDVARDRARVMSQVYLATLEVMHDRYFHGARAIVPARAMEDIFAELERQSGVSARWISVNLKPMSINHEPKSDFEKKAAKEIEAGKAEFEAIEGPIYRRASAVLLGNNCINCHSGLFAEPPKNARYAGLVISIPFEDKK